MALKILQWNCRSINNNRTDLLRLIDLQKPDVIVLSETWLLPGVHTQIRGFNIIRDDRDDGYGGSAILVRNYLPFSTIHININSDTIQMTAVKIKDLTVASFYLSSDAITYNDVSMLVQQLHPPYLLGGDFNSHNPIWGSFTINNRGRIIERLMDELDLIMHNDDQPTRLTAPGGNPSFVDRTLSSTNIAHTINCYTLDDTCGSDHFPIVTEIRSQITQPVVNKPKPNKKYNFKKADWLQYYTAAKNQVEPTCNFQSTAEKYNHLKTIISTATEKAIPKTTKSRHSLTPWWDKECFTLKEERKKAIGTYKKHPTLDNFLKAQNAIAKAKKIFKNKKRTSFRELCSNLNPNTPIKEMWKTVQIFKKSFSPREPTPINIACIEDILNNLVPNWATPAPLAAYDTPADPVLSNPFTREELSTIMSTVKLSAPGHDGITYWQIKHLPSDLKLLYLEIINDIFQGNNVPPEWKTVHILPILKPGKDKSLATSYRPIALSACPLKIAEHLVKQRLDWWLENRRILPTWQCGFRKGKSTLSCLTKLTIEIQKSFQRKEYLVAVFLDLSSAFDNVLLSLLAEKLKELRIPFVFSNFILKLIHDKAIYIKNNNGTIHGPSTLNKGLMQGSAISPILFNIYTASIHKLVTDPLVQYLQYVDDWVILTSNENLSIAIQSINQSLELLSSWLKDHNFSLSPSKSKAIIFTKKNNINPNAPIMFEGQAIPYCKEAKYLGVHFDQKLLWRQNTQNILSKSQKIANIMRYISKTWWGGHPQTMLLLYRSLMRPHFDYPSTIMTPISKTRQNELERMQHRAIRIALGAMKSTPINALMVEACEPPYSSRTRWLCSKFIMKQLGITNSPIIQDIRTLEALYRINHRVRNLPELASQYNKLITYDRHLEKSHILPCYSSPYWNQLSMEHVQLNLGVTKANSNRSSNEDLKIILMNKYPEYTHIFTDASKIKHNNATGYGICIPSHNSNAVQKIPEWFQIMTAEMSAILHAIRLSKELKIRKTLILTDSKSSLQTISRTGISAKIDQLTLRIKQLLIEANGNIKLAWIPSHCGIIGNEKADSLAKTGAELNVNPAQLLCSVSEFLPEIRNSIIQSWQEQWNISAVSKGTFFYNIKPTLTRKPWFHNLHLTKASVSTLTRIRLNHCSTPAHLNRIKVIDSDLCSCGERGDINHIFFYCSNHSNQSTLLYHNITKIIPAPINLETALSSNNIDVYILLTKFLQDLNINL